MTESSLTFPFSDLYSDVSEYRGEGRSPTSTPLAEAKRITNNGYRTFLAAYDWSFLKKTANINFEDGRWEYLLPDNFRQLKVPFKYPTMKGWPNPTERTEEELIDLRTGSGTTEGIPYCFALRASYFEGGGTRWEVIFHYTPDSATQAYYTYLINVDELVNDADIPIGGAEHSQLLRAFCLAEVEKWDEEKPGTWTEEIKNLLLLSIRMDEGKTPAGRAKMEAALQQQSQGR